MSLWTYTHPDRVATLLQDAMYEVSHHMYLKIIFPDWLLRWGIPMMRTFIAAHDELMVRRLFTA